MTGFRIPLEKVVAVGPSEIEGQEQHIKMDCGCEFDTSPGVTYEVGEVPGSSPCPRWHEIKRIETPYLSSSVADHDHYADDELQLSEKLVIVMERKHDRVRARLDPPVWSMEADGTYAHEEYGSEQKANVGASSSMMTPEQGAIKATLLLLVCFEVEKGIERHYVGRDGQ